MRNGKQFQHFQHWRAFGLANMAKKGLWNTLFGNALTTPVPMTVQQTIY